MESMAENTKMYRMRSPIHMISRCSQYRLKICRTVNTVAKTRPKAQKRFSRNVITLTKEKYSFFIGREAPYRRDLRYPDVDRDETGRLSGVFEPCAGAEDILCTGERPPPEGEQPFACIMGFSVGWFPLLAGFLRRHLIPDGGQVGLDLLAHVLSRPVFLQPGVAELLPDGGHVGLLAPYRGLLRGEPRRGRSGTAPLQRRP